MKEDKLSGCLRIYTQEHIALIFYRAGNPLGFFHDGSTELETTADTSLSVARLPGAKIDVLSTTADEEQVLVDLMESVDISKLWNREVETTASLRLQSAEAEQRTQVSRVKEQREMVFHLFRHAAEAQLGKIGVSLVEKEFEKVSDLDEANIERFYAAIAKTAKLVAGPSRIEPMLDEMQRGLRSILKS